MTLDEFTQELDRKFASMSEEELKSALRKAGFEVEGDCIIETFWNEDVLEDVVRDAVNSNEMALAA